MFKFLSAKYLLGNVHLDLLGLRFLGLGHSNGQNAVLVGRAHLVGVDARGQADAAAEFSDIAFTALGVLEIGRASCRERV